MALPRGTNDGPGHSLGALREGWVCGKGIFCGEGLWCQCCPGLGPQEAGRRAEVGPGPSRAAWGRCTAFWGNGRSCGCRCPSCGGSRGRPSGHTRRSDVGRRFCRLMGKGESGTQWLGLPTLWGVHVLCPILLEAHSRGDVSGVGERWGAGRWEAGGNLS